MDRVQLIQKLNQIWHETSDNVYYHDCPVCGCMISSYKIQQHKEYHILQLESLVYIHKLINPTNDEDE